MATWNKVPYMVKTFTFDVIMTFYNVTKIIIDFF